MDLEEIGWNAVDWIILVQNRNKWRAVVKVVMEFRVEQSEVLNIDYLRNNQFVQEGLCSVVLVSWLQKLLFTQK